MPLDHIPTTRYTHTNTKVQGPTWRTILQLQPNHQDHDGSYMPVSCAVCSLDRGWRVLDYQVCFITTQKAIAITMAIATTLCIVVVVQIPLPSLFSSRITETEGHDHLLLLLFGAHYYAAALPLSLSLSLSLSLRI